MTTRAERMSLRLPLLPREPLRPVLWRLLLCLAAPLAYGVSSYAAANPLWAEAYTKGYSALTGWLSRLIGLLPFSLAEISILPLAIGLVALMVHRFRRRQPLRALTGLALAAALLYASFAAGWGVAYHRLPYADTAGLTVKPRSVEALTALCETLVTETNALRATLRENADGVYAPAADGLSRLGQVQGTYDVASDAYPWLASRQGAPKPVLLSEAMSYLQISGIYIPFTFEANVNMNDFPAMLAATACHEAAHQRGWAREDEANFIAYLVCRESDDPDFQYSGQFIALIHAMNALHGADAEAFSALASQYSDGLRRDLAAHSAHWAQYEGKASEVQQKVNDAYLKVNKQQDGVRSYGRMVDLLLAEQGMD